MPRSLVLYDGECGLCSRVVRFVLKHDQKGFIYFSALQSAYATETLEAFEITSPDLNTFYFIEGEKNVFSRSEAAIRLFIKLFPKLRALKVLLLIPQSARDSGYDFIAKNRHRFFPNDACIIPTRDEMDRFLS